MTRAVAQTPSDLVLSSTTESQEAIDHAVSEEWKEPFIPKAQKEADEKAKVEAAKATLEAVETPEQKTEREAKEAEIAHADETPEQKAQRIADEEEPVKGKWSKRVNKLTARLARSSDELQQERTKREDLERRLSALERGETAAPRVEGTPEAVPDLPNKPKRIDFQDEAQYVEKLIQWTKANEDYREGMQEEQERFKQVFKAHTERIDDARDRYEDWDAVAKAAGRMFLPIQVDMAIREMENSADVFYFLAKTPAAFEKMGKMSPSQQIVEAGRISDKLAAGNRGNGNGNGASRRQRTAPPEPITPGGRRSTATKTNLTDIANTQGVDATEQYIRERRAMRTARRAN